MAHTFAMNMEVIEKFVSLADTEGDPGLASRAMEANGDACDGSATLEMIQDSDDDNSDKLDLIPGPHPWFYRCAS